MIDYIPSWLDGATTLLEKLNKCIDKIESTHDELTNKTKAAQNTADNALSLAKTNEADIALNEADITALQADNTTNKANITALQADNTTNKANITVAQNTADSANLTAQNALAKANQNEAALNEKQDKLKLYKATLNFDTDDENRALFIYFRREEMSTKAEFVEEFNQRKLIITSVTGWDGVNIDDGAVPVLCDNTTFKFTGDVIVDKYYVIYKQQIGSITNSTFTQFEIEEI